MKLATSLPIAVMLVLRAVSASAAAPPNYPERPVRLVVPFGAGGSYDPVARVIAVYVGESIKQQIIVDNRGGASGIIGAEIIAMATPDAYTVGLIGNNHTITQALRNDVPYDVLKDFSVISRLGVVDNAVVVHPSLPVKTLKDFIALARAHPGKYNFGSGGATGTTHFGGELFNSLAGTRILHVPYKGGGLAVLGLVGGEVQMMVLNMINADPHMKAGRLRGLAMAAKTRHPLQPDLPTTAEAGLPGMEMSQWYGFVLPNGVPRNLFARWQSELKRMVELLEAKQRLASQGVTAMFETPQQFHDYMKFDIETMRKLAKQADIRAE